MIATWHRKFLTYEIEIRNKFPILISNIQRSKDHNQIRMTFCPLLKLPTDLPHFLITDRKHAKISGEGIIEDLL